MKRDRLRTASAGWVGTYLKLGRERPGTPGSAGCGRERECAPGLGGCQRVLSRGLQYPDAACGRIMPADDWLPLIRRVHGNATAGYGYDIFGATRSESGTGDTDFKFTGEQLDADSELYYLRARYYDLETGRFERHRTVRPAHTKSA